MKNTIARLIENTSEMINYFEKTNDNDALNYYQGQYNALLIIQELHRDFYEEKTTLIHENS
jgi:hypothetical protein